MKLLNKSGMRPMLLGAVAVLAMPMSLNAQDFAGETIEWTVPFGVGGGTDVWARFFAPQLSQALPGKPTVVSPVRIGIWPVIGLFFFWYFHDEVL